jgi:hypothetical protein
LQDIRGYDPAYSSAYGRFIAASFDPDVTGQDLASLGSSIEVWIQEPGPVAGRAFDLLNVKYIFTDCSVRLSPRRYVRLYQGAGCVYRNLTVLPRAFLVHRIGWASPLVATVQLARGLVNPRTTALLDAGTARRVAWRAIPLPSEGGDDTVTVTHYGLNAVDLAVRATVPSVLVLTDADASGWVATIDGRDTPIARADGVFRAIEVPAGWHHVSFSYQPEAFAVGVIISAASLIVWLLLALVAVCQARAVAVRRTALQRPAASPVSLRT